MKWETRTKNDWPLLAPSLPLSGEVDETLRVKFTHDVLGKVKATVYNTETGMIEDVILEHSFDEAYDRVRSEYPALEWRRE